MALEADAMWSSLLRPARVRAGLRERVSIDTRALSALRIALGALLLADLALRARDLTAFYTDQGVLTLSGYIATSEPLHLSIHAISGEAWVQAILFLLAGALGAALLVGYRTTTATVGSWLLLVSLQNRMPVVLNSGDVLLRVLLFWAIFLPLGARWSVDSRHGRATRGRVLRVAGVALLLQTLLVYVINAVFKLGGEVWLAGNGIEYVLSLGQFTILLGDVLAPVAGWLWPLDYLWLAMLSFSWLLLGLTGRWRGAFVGLFALMHLGMALTMQLGLFPFVSIASLLPFLPATVWDSAMARLGGAPPVNAGRQGLDRLSSWLPRITVGDVPPALQRLRSAVTTVIPIVFVVLILLWNLQHLGLNEVVDADVSPDETEWALELTRTDQYWNMFAPNPLNTDGWVVAPGLLENGSRVDAFGGGQLTFDRPPDVSATFPNARWRKYLSRLWRYDTVHRDYFAEYLCDRWNRQRETRLENVTAVYMTQRTRIDGSPEPIDRVTLAEVDCAWSPQR